MANPVSPARKAALRLILGVMQQSQSLFDMSGQSDGPLGTISPADRARALSLARCVLRNQAAIDAILQNYIALDRTPVAVVTILRLCAAELWVFQAASYGVVDSAVNLTASSARTRRFKGLVNAVARKLAKHPVPNLKETPQPLPKAMRGQLKALFDQDRIDQIEVAHQRGAPIDITLKDIKQAETFAKRLNAQIMPQGSLRLPDPVQISALPGFSEGDWWVQDAAAALPAQLISGQRVLDLCAAPGGKTLQLAAMGADVTAVDISAGRLRRLSENLRRTGLKADVICADALDYHPNQKFDAILLDAPCSASGTIRRHPDLPFIKGNADLGDLLALQRALLRHAISMLAPGGQLIYATCSLFAAEGEAQAQWARQELPVALQPIDPRKLGLTTHFGDENGCLRLVPDLWPDQGGLDGFFVAEFRAKAR